MKRVLSLFIAILFLLTSMPIQVFADGDTNADIGHTSGHQSGDASTKDVGYWDDPMGVRVSIYWAPAPDGASTYDELAINFTDNSLHGFKGDSKKVIQIGNAIDIVQGTAPHYDVLFYSNYSIFDYMNQSKSKSYLKIMSDSKPYKYFCTSSTKVFNDYNKDNDVNATDKNDFGSFVSEMPSIKSASSKEWEEWFTGSTDKNIKTYINISKLTEMCGKYISPDDIASGIYKGKNGSEEGVYKVFFEPLISVKFANRKGTFWTLRDAIKYGLASKSVNQGRDLDWQVTNLGKMFEYLGLIYLQYDEDCLNMKANKTDYQIDFTKQGHNDVVKSLSPGGKAYEMLGVGCVSPQRDNFSSRIKVVTSYVKYVPQVDGSYKLEQCMPTDVKYFSKDALANTLESDKTTVGLGGTGYLNDILTSSRDLTKDSDAKKIVWETGCPINTETGDKVSAKFIKSLNLGLKTRAVWCIQKGLNFDKTATERFLKLITTLSSSLNATKSASGDDLNNAYCDEFDYFLQSSDYLDFDLSNLIYGLLYKKDAVALSYYKDYGVAGDIQYMIDNAKLIRDYRDIVLGSSKSNTVYLRYIVANPPIQIPIVKLYKNDKYVKTVVLPKVSVKCNQAVNDSGDIVYYVPTIKSVGAIDKDFKEATLEKWETSTEINLEGMPKTVLQHGKSLTVGKNLMQGENIYTTFRLDEYNADDKLIVPQWRLSTYYDKIDYDNKAISSLELKADEGHLSSQSFITPSGVYNYNTVNPNGKITSRVNSVDSMKFTDWLHAKTVTKGSYAISHDNNTVAVSTAGELNAIKTSAISGLKLASWVTDNKKSLLDDYDIKDGTGSKDSASKTIRKFDTLKFGIKNADSYTHYYSVDNDYYVPGSDGGTPKDKSDDTAGYWVCGCYMQAETPKVSYTTADYDIGVTYNLYNALETDKKDIIKVKSSKSETNGKTTIVKQSGENLTIVPEVPMLFEADNQDESVVFVAGTEKREISVVDYHTLTYTAYVDATVTGTQVMDSRAKVKARAIGLGSNPVFSKGAPLSVAYKVNKSENSKSKGILTVKSYALDIDDNSLKDAWGNEDYDSSTSHSALLKAFDNFSKGTATEQLLVTAPGGTATAFEGGLVKNSISYDKQNTTTKTHTLVVRSGKLIRVDGDSLSTVKLDNPALYDALKGMKLVGDKDDTVLKTLVANAGDKLTESAFASQAKAERGVADIKVGDGWYCEDSTVLVVKEFTTTYDLPIAMFSDKIPMTVKGLETPANKMQFFSKMSLGYNVLTYTMTSSDLGTGLGRVKIYFEHNSQKDSTFGKKSASYGVSNTTINDSNFSGGF